MAAEFPNCGVRYRYADSLTDCQNLVDGGGYCIRCGERIEAVAKVIDPSGLIPREAPRKRSIDLKSRPRDSDGPPSPPWAFA